MKPLPPVHASALLALGGSTWTALHYRRWGLDDAYISYRYAQNWIEGHGLVFNPGEAVEGYTNFLYIALMAPGLALFGADAIYAWSVAFNTLLLVAAVYAVHAATSPRLDGYAWLPSLLCAVSPGLWVAAWSGLETTLVFALFTTAWAALVRLQSATVGGADAPMARSAMVLAVALVGLVLARADGFILAAAFLGYLAIAEVRRRDFRALLLCTAAAGGTVLVQVAARLSYYGHPLPNSYYAKVSGELPERLASAWKLFPELAPVLPFILIIVIAAPAAWAASVQRARTDSGAVRLPALVRYAPPFEVGFPIAWLAYWFYVGGDVFRERFLLLLIPLGAYLLLEQGRRVRPAVLRRVGGLAVLTGLLLLPWSGTDLVTERTREDRFIRLGRFLGKHHPGALLAVDAAGKVPFFSRLRTIDMYGLTDPTIGHGPGSFEVPGHSKSDPAYVLGRQPDLIAGWLDPATLTVNPGLGFRAYTGAGYRLSLLTYTPKGNHWKDLGPEPIIDAAGFSLRQIRDYWNNDYRYAVLEHAERRTQAPLAALGTTTDERSPRRDGGVVD